MNPSSIRRVDTTLDKEVFPLDTSWKERVRKTKTDMEGW